MVEYYASIECVADIDYEYCSQRNNTNNAPSSIALSRMNIQLQCDIKLRCTRSPSKRLSIQWSQNCNCLCHCASVYNHNQER